jgi:hypothetical protein
MKKIKYNENYFEKIYHGFYFESNFFLPRKKIIFDEVINITQTKKKYRKK